MRIETYQVDRLCVLPGLNIVIGLGTIGSNIMKCALDIFHICFKRVSETENLRGKIFRTHEEKLKKHASFISIGALRLIPVIGGYIRVYYNSVHKKENYNWASYLTTEPTDDHLKRAFESFKLAGKQGNKAAWDKAGEVLWKYISQNNDLTSETKIYLKTKVIKYRERADKYLAFTMGRSYLEVQDFISAEKHFQKAIEENENSPIILIEIGKAYLEVSNIEKADEYFKKIIDCPNAAVENFITIGKFCLEEIKDPEKAVEKAGEYFKVVKNHPFATEEDLITIGKFFIEKIETSEKAIEKADEYFKVVLDCPVSTGEELITVGKLYLEEIKDPEKAIEYFKMASLQRGSGNRKFINDLNNIGSIYLGHRKIEKADEYFKKVLDCPMATEEDLITIGKLYLEKIEDPEKAVEKADEYFKKLLFQKDTVNLKIVNDLNKIGRIYLDYRKYEKAKYYFEQAQEKGSLAGLNNLGILHYQQNNLDTAENCFKKCLQSVSPKNLAGQRQIYCELIVVYKAKNDSANAAFYLTEAQSKLSEAEFNKLQERLTSLSDP